MTESTKEKKEISKIFMKFWIAFGIIIFAWETFWFVRVKILHDYTFIINVVFFSVGIFAAIAYAIISIIFLILAKNGKK